MYKQFVIETINDNIKRWPQFKKQLGDLKKRIQTMENDTEITKEVSDTIKKEIRRG